MPPFSFLAGGTTLIDLMKLDVMRPTRIVDLGGLASRYQHIEMSPKGLRLGAFATMATAANHPDVKTRYPRHRREPATSGQRAAT